MKRHQPFAGEKTIRTFLCTAVLTIVAGLYTIAQAAPLGNVQSLAWNAANSWFDVSCGTAKLRIVYYRDDIFRIWVAPAGTFDPGAYNECVVYTTPLATPPTLTDAGTYYKLESKECVLRINKTPCTFSLYRKDNTTVVFEEQSPIDITANQTSQTLKPETGDYFYGGGAWHGHFCLNGQVCPAQYTGKAYGAYDENMNPNAAPWYCNLKGYGAFRNTWQPGTYTFKTPVTTVHTEGRFDCYYFYGPSLKKVLDGYTLITGRPHMPPRWGLDFFHSGNYTAANFPSGTIYQACDAFVTHDFPMGMVMPNDMTGQPFSPVQAMVAPLKAKNINCGMWLGVFANDTSMLTSMVHDWGIRFFKADNEWIGVGGQQAFRAFETFGPNGIEKYSPDSARTFLEFTAGWAGTQRFGWAWTGDDYCTSIDWIRWHTPSLNGACMSGINGYCSELESILGPKDPQIFLRCQGWQMFSPYMTSNGDWQGYTHWPWVVAPTYENLCRNLWKLRSRLIPYMYTQMYEAWSTGVSIQRPPMLEFPDDPNTWDNGTTADPKSFYEFMFGPWFLIRPIFENLTTTDKITMYLPGTSNTRWINYWAGDVQTGGQNIQAYAGGFSISGQNIVTPVYIREGAVIPMWPPQYYKTVGTVTGVFQRPMEPLTLDVYPHRSEVSTYSYYEDDGNSRDFKKGKFATTAIKSDATQWAAGQILKLSIGAVTGDYSGKPATRVYVAQIHTGTINKSAPSHVYVDNVEIPLTTMAACTTSTTGAWFLDAADRGGILWVKTATLSTTTAHSITTNIVVGTTHGVTERTVLNTWQVSAKNDGSIRVSFANRWSGAMDATLYDMQGRVMVRKTVNVVNGATMVSGGKVTNGNYVLQLACNGKSAVKKFVVQK